VLMDIVDLIFPVRSSSTDIKFDVADLPQ
jgi:hypothetical protein